MLHARVISPNDPRYQPLFKLGYYQVDIHHGAVLFWRYRHFAGSGILGVAYIPAGTEPDFEGWMQLSSTPPHFENRRLPPGFFIFSED